MAITKPFGLESAPPVSEAALKLDSELARNRLTIFRFRTGLLLVFTALALFLVGHLAVIEHWFTKDFPGHAWMMTWILLVLGAAFSGKEVASALFEGIRLFQKGLAHK